MADDIEPLEDRALLDALGALPWPRPPASLSRDFHARARRMRRDRTRWRLPAALGLVAVLMLLLSAGWLREHRARLREGAALHQQFAAAMQSVSAGERLTAIAAATRRQPAGDVERALVAALLTDQSANVRVAAADALGRIASPATLGSALRHALALERSPFVQVAMLHATVRLSATDRREAVQELLSRPDVDASVRDDALSLLAANSAGDSR